MIQKDRWSGCFHFTESRKCSWMGGSLDGGSLHGWGGGSLHGWGGGGGGGEVTAWMGGHWMGGHWMGGPGWGVLDGGSWMGGPGWGVTGWESLLNTGSQALSATRVARAARLLSRLVVFMRFPQNLVKWWAKCRCLSFWHCWFH